MDAQTLVAIGLSAACGLWALWRFIRPLVRPEAHCSDCAAPPPADLLQIDPVEPQKR